MPYKVIITIASGPESFVPVLVTDIGLLASPAGWEIYAGGHAGHPVKQGFLLGTVESIGEAAQLASACLQWYRQTAWFDEPLWAWMDRLGSMSIREILLDTRFQQELVLNREQERVHVASVKLDGTQMSVDAVQFQIEA